MKQHPEASPIRVQTIQGDVTHVRHKIRPITGKRQLEAGSHTSTQDQQTELPALQLATGNEKEPTQRKNIKQGYKNYKSGYGHNHAGHGNYKSGHGHNHAGHAANSYKKYDEAGSQNSAEDALFYFGSMNAASGNESDAQRSVDNFDQMFAAALAYFQQIENKSKESLSDTDGSKAISEGSSTAEGAASAAEGHWF